ncbi:MAG: class I SAM-dependent methyltransferase [Gammaproteobacteria bacterium]|nr:class I SAM-dependent methyltransferase [Gammaproteobacteria bacterium]
MKNNQVLAASFRDPSGFLFFRGSTLLRQVNLSYQEDFDCLMESGLYTALVKARLLIPHREAGLEEAHADNAYKVIQPERIEYISYPYEWCFSQLKDAALTTLRIQSLALEHEMTLKDASAYNIQFHRGGPMLIDTLSFERYREGRPWVAYRQFCQHFLAPLALMSYTDIRLNQLLRTNIDGVPLDLAAALLPWRTRLRFSLLTHIHLHARSQRHYADAAGDGSKDKIKTAKVSRLGLKGIIENLASAVRALQWKPGLTEWGDYYADTNYEAEAMQRKQTLVSAFLEAVSPVPRMVQDLGANTGMFSRIAAQRNIPVISQDIDAAAVEKNYLRSVEQRETNILPLLLDLTNPSPAIGWANEERMSLPQRGPVDVVLALALIHHLAISNNVPLDRLAAFFSQICRHLIVEFIPKSDSQVQRLLATRKDVFPNYAQIEFEKKFSLFFQLIRSESVKGSGRVLYLMKSKSLRQDDL